MILTSNAPIVVYYRLGSTFVGTVIPPQSTILTDGLLA